MRLERDNLSQAVRAYDIELGGPDEKMSGEFF